MIKPILFNTEMVRAILDGRKTVTRRVTKPQPKSKLCYAFAGSHKKDIGRWGYPSKTAHEFWGEEFKLPDDITEEELKKKWNPPYHTDDILYVRETWGEGYQEGYIYKADDKLANLPEFKESSKLIYHPSIHMPKEAARIWLKVKAVRVERLQEITEDHALSEGVPDDSDYPISKVYCPRCLGEGLIGAVGSNLGYMEVDCPDCDTAIKRFKNLWNSTIKKSGLDIYGWDVNPWVWVIKFERCEKPF